MKMKIKTFILIAIAVISLSSLSVFAIDPIRENFDKIMEKYNSDKKNEEMMNKNLTESQKKSKAMVDAKLKDAWEDIKKTYQIDETLYLKVDFSGLDKFFDGKYENFSDMAFLKEVRPMLIRNLFEREIPSQSLVPNILIKNDKNEILIAYKLQNGDNYTKKFIKKDDKWEESEQVLKGKPVMEMEK